MSLLANFQVIMHAKSDWTCQGLGILLCQFLGVRTAVRDEKNLKKWLNLGGELINSSALQSLFSARPEDQTLLAQGAKIWRICATNASSIGCSIQSILLRKLCGLAVPTKVELIA